MLDKHEHSRATRTFDGIVDNRSEKIPWYFTALFYGLVIWAVGYMGIFLFGGWSSHAEFARKMETHQAATAQPLPHPVDDDLNPEQAAALFTKRCAVCHGKDARGGVGPDLHRAEFSYGKGVDTLIETITRGRPGGMPAFGTRLSHEEIEALARHLRSLD